MQQFLQRSTQILYWGVDRCQVQLGVSFEPTDASIAWLLTTKWLENSPKWADRDCAAPKVRLMENLGSKVGRHGKHRFGYIQQPAVLAHGGLSQHFVGIFLAELARGHKQALSAFDHFAFVER